MVVDAMDPMHPFRFGKYLLIEQISRGGMAEIFLAKSTGVRGFEKVLVIKRILPLIAEDPDFQTMFIDEAKISSSLGHPNIGQVFEFGQIGETYFLTMEYISGKDVRAIRARLAEHKRHMPIEMALYIGGQLCQALDHAHRMTTLDGDSMQIVHRDVSPPNVVVGYKGGVKLIDFGIARARSRLTRTRTGKLKGKFAYMSPEQVEGAVLDHRSDVFSCGTVLFEMLTHQRPFRGDNELSVMNAIRAGRCPPPSAINPDVPLAVDQIVEKALARDRDQRFQWASELYAEIQQYFVRTKKDYGAPQLSTWMSAAFAAEIEEERLLLKRLRELRPEDCDVALIDEDDDDDGDTITEGPLGVRRSQSAIAGSIEELDEHTLDDSAADAPVADATSAPPGSDTSKTAPPPPPDDDEWGDLAGASEDVVTDELAGAPTQIGRPDGMPAPDTAEPGACQPNSKSGPIYPDGSSGVVGGALDVHSNQPEFADARGLSGPQVEVDGPVETYPTAAPPLPEQKTLRSLAPMPIASQDVGDDPISQLKTKLIALYRQARERFDELSSQQVIVVTGGATLLLVGLIIALASTCSGGAPEPGDLKPSQVGSVLVTTSEAAACTIKLDGRPHGLLHAGGTLTIANVRAGGHVISLKCHGFVPYSATVKIKPGDVTLFDAPLKQE